MTAGRHGAGLQFSAHGAPGSPMAEPPHASRDLSSYVSRLLANRLASGGPFAGPEWRTVRGAVLLTDVVGFTAQTQRLTGSGPGGIEELARAFNAYFCDVVGLVYGHGGDVLSIAGDSFFSYWPAAEGDDGIGEAVLRAAQAGQAIQRGLDARSAVEDIRMETRAGISAGEMRIGLVGGVSGRWETMPTGRAIDEVARAEQTAPAGAVVLAESAWAALGSRCSGRPLDHGLVALVDVLDPVEPRPAPSLTTPDPPGELLQSFVPLPVRQRQMPSDTEWLQEMRQVTVVMASLLDLAEPDARQLDSTHRAVAAFQSVIAHFEGAAKVCVDNKGVTLSAAFGLPPRAHEDDVRRGILAAEAFREKFVTMGLRCTVGIATGRAFCGVFGSDLRREYTMHGEVITLAARLMQASTGEILCTDTTARAARGQVTFDAARPLDVKGRAEPVPVRRLRSLQPSEAPADAPMVGREAEREMIADHIRRLATGGDHAALVVEGDAGLGKSRLAAEAVRQARAAGATVLTAAADAVERSTNYYAWRHTFAELLGATTESGARVRDSELLARVAQDPELERLLPLLESVVPAGIPDNELTAAMPGDVRAGSTKALLAAIFREATASQPALLVVEDAHWLDSNSWALLFEVVQTVPRLLTVITTRPAADARPPGYQRLCEQASTQVVRLANLTSRETRALVEQRLGVSELPAPLARFLEEHVAGHPFFCEELVRSMRETGVVRVEDGVAVLGDLDAFDLPATIEGAVVSRLDRLSSGELLCLKVAAVIGRSFLSRTVGQSLPLEAERPTVHQNLQTLSQLDLTALEAIDPEPSYVFCHEITREVAYELLTHTQRRQLHRVVAQWHERTYSHEELAPHFALLAHHWSRAEVPDKAVEYLEYAGQQALRGGAFREALHFLSRAIEVEERSGVAPDQIRRALCEKGLGTAHYFLGDLNRSRELLRRALARLDREVPTGRVRTLAGLARVGCTQAAHLVRPRHYRERRTFEQPVLDEAVGCYKILGQIGYLDGEPPQNLLYLTFAGVNIGEESGPSPHLARMLIHAGTACGIVGLKRPADHYAARAVAMTESGGHTEAGAYVWSIKALIEAHRGNWRGAVEANRIALARIREVGDFNLEAEVWQTRSAIHICEGNYGAAEAAWLRTRELGKRNGNPQVLCWSLLDEVETRIGRDEVDQAAAALEAALEVPTPEGDGSDAVEKHYATALVRAGQGRWGEAVHAADAVVDRVGRQPPAGFHWVDFCAGAVDVIFDSMENGGAFAADMRAELEAKAERGNKVVRRVSRQFGNVRPRRFVLQGLLEWQRGDHDGAIRAWRRGERLAARKDMPFERARARYEIARHGGAGSHRDAWLEDASDTFRALGASQMVRRVREAQAEGS